uniref:DUF4455 domain-containing protein n=1 Tax=Strigamia maritima TaxID=126957 RepID=T1J7T1_STRMM
MNSKTERTKNQKPFLLFEGDQKLSKALEKLPNVVARKIDPISNEVTKRDKPIESSAGSYINDIKDVVNLQDTIVPALPKSNIIERYTESRKTRHAEILNELYSTLDFFGNETKDGLQYVFQHLSSSINENRREINEMIKSLKCEEAFQTDTDIQSLWTCIDVKYEENKIWLEEFCCTLVKQETFKLYKIQELLWKISNKLTIVGHWTQNEVYDYIFNLAMELQKLSLNNQKYFSVVKWTLVMHDVNLKLKHFATWNEFWQKWLTDIKNSSLDQFKVSIKAMTEGEYGYIKNLITKFKHDCDLKVKERMAFLYTIRNIKPPNCSKDTVLKWTESYKSLNTEHENICASFGKEIKMDNPDLQNQLKEDLNNIKKSLTSRNVCSVKTVDQILGDENLQVMQDYLVYLNLTIEKHHREKQYERDGLDAIEKFTITAVENAVGLWEVHKTKLNDLNRCVETKSDKLLDELDERSNFEERNLGVVLDRLRQAGTEDCLQTTLKQTLHYLSQIEDNYKLFIQKRIDLHNNLPSLILQEINRYRVDLKTYFGLAVGYLLDPIIEPANDATTTDFTASHLDINYTDKGDDKSWKDIETVGLAAPSYPTGTFSNVELTVSQILTLPPHAFSSVQLTKWSDSKTWVGNESRLQHVMRILGVNFAAHWENLLIQSVRQADAIRDNKITELNNELEFRLKFHKTRIKRIYKDIVDVRRGELATHDEKMEEKITLVKEALHERKTKFQELSDAQSESMKLLLSKINAMEAKMLKATLAEKLIKQKRELEEIIGRHITNEINELDKLSTENMCNQIVNSNNAFINSLRSFHENGNFSEDEIVRNTTKILELNATVEDFREYSKNVKLDMETRWRIEEDTIISNYMEKWEFAELDLDFIENIHRRFRTTILKIKNEVKATLTTNKKLEAEMNAMSSTMNAEASTSGETIENCLEVYTNMISNSVQRGIQLGVIVPPDSEDGKKRKEKPKYKSHVASLVYSNSSNVKSKIATADLLFTEPPETGPNMQSVVQNLLWNTQNEVVSIAEDYYQKRGVRSTPFEIPDNIENSYKSIESTLKKFWNKSKDFCAENILEFCSQAEHVETVAIDFLKYACNQEQKSHVSQLDDKISKLNQSAEDIIERWNNTIKMSGKNFIIKLNNLAADLIKVMDPMLTTKEINDIKNEIESPVPPAKMLVTVMPPTSYFWPGLNNYVLGDKTDSESYTTNRIETLKKRPIQENVINYRDVTYRAFGETLNNVLAQATTKMKKNIGLIDQWHESFFSSVNALKDASILYR